MGMAMVQVGDVRMLVHDGAVLMHVRVRLGDGALMRMAMMLVMVVKVLVQNRLVRMHMAVAFANEDRNANHHQRGATENGETRQVAEYGY